MRMALAQHIWEARSRTHAARDIGSLGPRRAHVPTMVGGLSPLQDAKVSPALLAS